MCYKKEHSLLDWKKMGLMDTVAKCLNYRVRSVLVLTDSLRLPMTRSNLRVIQRLKSTYPSMEKHEEILSGTHMLIPTQCVSVSGWAGN